MNFQAFFSVSDGERRANDSGGAGADTGDAG